MKRFFLIYASVMLLTGCKITERVVYLQDIPMTDSTFVIKAAESITIRPGDKLSIIVNTSIPEMAAIFNLAVPYKYVGTQNANTSSSQSAYYTVDEMGEIDFPIIGKIKVAGKKRTEIADDIKSQLLSHNLLKDVVVTVDYGNLTFSVIGEVNSPGRYSFDKDRINILEAISMAKDLTINGRRDNILLTRTDEQGRQQTFRIDLRDSESLYSSPAFSVQQNDIIYVEPNSYKARQSTVSANTILTPSFWISLATLATTITALLIR